MSLLAVAFIAVHVATAIADPYVTIGIAAAVIPFTSPYKPLWLGLGAISLDMIIALIVTSLARARIGRRTWRAVHWLAYACWPVAVLHGIGSSTDMQAGWLLAAAIGCIAAVLAAACWRIGSATAAPGLAARPARALSDAELATGYRHRELTGRCSMSALAAAGPEPTARCPGGRVRPAPVAAVGPPSSCRRIATGPRSGRAPAQARAAQVPWRSAHRASRGRRADRTGRRGVPGRQETRRSRSRRPGRGSRRQRRRRRARQQQGRRAALVRTRISCSTACRPPLRRSAHGRPTCTYTPYDSRRRARSSRSSADGTGEPICGRNRPGQR